MSAKFISSFCKINITYAWTNGWTDKQTDKSHKRDGPNWPTGLDIHVSTDGKQGQTDKLDGPTNERTGWTDRTDGQPDERTDELERRTVWTAKQTGWTDGRTDELEGQTDQTDRKDGSNGLDGRTDAPKSWIKRTKGQTRGHMERTHGQMNWIKRPDGRTDWSQVLCGSRRFRLF